MAKKTKAEPKSEPKKSDYKPEPFELVSFGDFLGYVDNGHVYKSFLNGGCRIDEIVEGAKLKDYDIRPATRDEIRGLKLVLESTSASDLLN